MVAVRDPGSLVAIEFSEWDELLARARRYNLLPRLGSQLEALGLLERVPDKARERFLGARLWAELNQTDARHEIHRLLRALDGLDVPIVLLKGAAYLMASLPPFRGRVFADLDILVPEERIDEVEQRLLAGGWEGAEMDAYDERYYRNWAHEIPPLTHPARNNEVDIHHTIVPRVSRPTPDASALLEAAQPLDDPRLKTLGPADMVLHGAVHLFHEEFKYGLRELLDLSDLLGHFGRREGFWGSLLPRAQRHGLERPLYYVLRYSERVLKTSIPPAIMNAASAAAPIRPVGTLMDWIVPLALIPDTPERPRYGSRLARWMLYVRSHWLRMPVPLLVYHLSVKAMHRARNLFRAAGTESVE